MEEDDADVPPLEDMTEAFNNSLNLREQQKLRVPVKRSEILEVPDDTDKLESQRIEKLLEKRCSDTQVRICEVKVTNKSTNTYCGFKKGFLAPQQSSKRTNNNKVKEMKGEEVTVVTKNVDEGKNVLPEVQEAISQQIPILESNGWVTEDLLSKISSHPKLSKQFMDPRFAEVIQKFHTNPEEIMCMCQSNPEMREFIQDFCGIMGNHFTELGNQQDQKSFVQVKKGTEKSSDIKSGDEKEMQAILSDPEISAILKTVEIQKLLRVLKEEPDKAQKLLQSANVVLRRKIQRLIDVGLLQMAV